MRKLGPALCATLVLLATTSGQAQQIDLGAPSPKSAEMLRTLQFGIVGGRIAVNPLRQGLRITTETREHDSGRWERLTIDITGSAPVMQFEQRTKELELSFDLSEGDHLIAKRVPQANPAAAIEFEQPTQGNLTLAIGPADTRRTVTAPTLWHLLLIEPEISRQHLIPLLQILRPGWHLDSQAVAVEDSLLRWAQSRRLVDRARLSELVADLASPQFARRRAAERDLAAKGQSALLFLASLEREQLDAEQWNRVRLLLSALSDTREDSVDRAGASLAGDPLVWLALAEREDLTRRQASAEGLRLLLGTPLDFDPAAAPNVRHKQLQRLRERLAAHRAAATSED